METEATQQTPSGPSAASASHPRWVLLEDYVMSSKAEAMGSCSAADAKTLATARTSSDHLIGVSLRLAPPPAASSVTVHLPEGVLDSQCRVAAAHGDSVLISVYFTEGYNDDTTSNYFVYNAGADPPRPPSLSLLPPCYAPEPAEPAELPKYGRRWVDKGPVEYGLDTYGTGLLRRGDDELAVASLKATPSSYGTREPKDAELVLFRSGQWSFKRPAIIYRGSSHVRKLPWSWTANSVHPVGDTQLCWVNMSHGLLFCDVFDEIPVLRHVALPAEADGLEPGSGPESSRAVCVTAGGTVKFIGVFPRCCCGGAGSTHCRRSRHAYTINTFTLKMDSMVWVMDGMVDATELWGLDAYEGLPRLLPQPLVSMDDYPHTICFLVCDWSDDTRNDKAGWLILVDTRRKAILPVSHHYDNARWVSIYGRLFPTKVYYNLDDSHPSSGNGNGALSLREGHMHIDRVPSSPVVAVDELQTNDAGSSALSSAENDMQVSAVLAAFQEIPSYGLDRDEMLKAYSILSHHDGHKLRSILRIPKNLRKDWLLMEIKAIEA